MIEHETSTAKVLSSRLFASACGRRSVLVLDNCDEVVAKTAKFVTRLLDACAEIRVLATSRERTELGIEHVLCLEPLSSESAKTLYLERMQSGDFRSINRALVDPVADGICERVDRVPAAIEMAAHWLAVLNPRDLYERLPDLLIGSQGERPSYPPTMSTILDMSYRLLEPTEQRFFERLSVLPRPFSYEEAAREGEETISETLDILRRLVRKSIVQRASGVVGEFELPRTHRAYGRVRRLERIAGA